MTGSWRSSSPCTIGDACEGERDRLQGSSLTQGPLPIGDDQLREPLGEDRPWTASSIASEATYSEAEDQAPSGQWQISDRAVIAAMDTSGPPPTQWATSTAPGSSPVQFDGLAVEHHLLKTKASQMRKERCKRHVHPRRR